MAVLNTSPYLSAPTSPNVSSPNYLDQFYSAPSSPVKAEEEDMSPNFDDFEFETSKKFGSLMEFEASERFECVVEVEQKQEKPKRERERSGSLPAMAFADELFANGLVMPLKPPPRLQSSIPSSPRSPTSSFKNIFVRRTAWNDDFDPFVVALKKVSEENRGRSSSAGSHHRRTRSHSPFRTSNESRRWDQESDHSEKMQNSGSNFNFPKELKGSPYARWVIDQTKQVEKHSPKGKKMLKGFTFVKRVRPVKNDQEGFNNNSKNKASFGEKIEDQDEGTMKRIKGILMKYASFRKVRNSEEKLKNQNSRIWGSSYLKKLSFKVKGNNASENGKKRMVVIEEAKMAMVEYKRNKPNLALCFHGIESPRKHEMNQ